MQVKPCVQHQRDFSVPQGAKCCMRLPSKQQMKTNIPATVVIWLDTRSCITLSI